MRMEHAPQTYSTQYERLLEPSAEKFSAVFIVDASKLFDTYVLRNYLP